MVLALFVCFTAMRHVQSWLHSSDINYESVEKAWENGDLDEELREEEDLMYKRRQAEEV